VIRLSSSLCRTILKLNNIKLENLFSGVHIFESTDFEITSPIAVIKNQKQKFVESFLRSEWQLERSNAPPKLSCARWHWLLGRSKKDMFFIFCISWYDILANFERFEK
jgi:hypothetical protein